MRREHVSDMITRDVETYKNAVLYFRTFFLGCDKFVPVFDPSLQTFENVRARSSMLFDAICTVGCRIVKGPSSPTYQQLNKELRKMICTFVATATEVSLECIQAMLVTACYTDAGWLLISVATRIAVQLDLSCAYDKAMKAAGEVAASTSTNRKSGYEDSNQAQLSEDFRRARTWLGLFVLENIFSLDRGKIPAVEAREDIRRCRALISHPSRTTLDLRLLSQVELNSIRTDAQARLSNADCLQGAQLAAFIRGTRRDLDIWLEDWLQAILRNTLDGEAQHLLILNLRIQRDWAELVICCRALKYTGLVNIATMTEIQRELIYMAKKSAQRHFEKLLASPKLYLAPFRYAMDFVWAKCAFSVLLLLKLAILLPENSDLTSLLVDARRLLDELANIEGPQNIYFRILSLGVEKAWKTVDAYTTQGVVDGTVYPLSGAQEAETDFQTYIPKEFIYDWEFPGLNLNFVPIEFETLFGDFVNM